MVFTRSVCKPLYATFDVEWANNFPVMMSIDTGCVLLLRCEGDNLGILYILLELVLIFQTQTHQQLAAQSGTERSIVKAGKTTLQAMPFRPSSVCVGYFHVCSSFESSQTSNPFLAHLLLSNLFWLLFLSFFLFAVDLRVDHLYLRPRNFPFAGKACHCEDILLLDTNIHKRASPQIDLVSFLIGTRRVVMLISWMRAQKTPANVTKIVQLPMCIPLAIRATMRPPVVRKITTWKPARVAPASPSLRTG